MSLFEAVIGLEVHAQLQTQSKVFSEDPNLFGQQPNALVGPVSAGVPGALPSLNIKAVELAVKIGLALKCAINLKNRFSRKHYFYPDLPKGYQITQFDEPICGPGFLEIEVPGSGKLKKIEIDHIHIEEDAGKSQHLGSLTLVNLNRAGVPLVEIVSKPDLRSPGEAVAYLKKLHELLVFLEVSDGNMEEGNFRCDANVSVRRLGEEQFGTRTEIKNLNSFRFVEKAVEFEIARQIAVVDAGGKIVRETRGWDAAGAKTYSMRSKELAEDYRYFPDPDLPELILDPDWIEKIRSTLAEDPQIFRKGLLSKYGLSQMDVDILLSRKDLFRYFEECVLLGSEPKRTANWICEELLRRIRMAGPEAQIADLKLQPERFVKFLDIVSRGLITGKSAKVVIREMLISLEEPSDIVERLGLKKTESYEDHEKWVEKIVIENPEPWAEYKSGKQKALGFLVGAVMKESKGKADPEWLDEIFKKMLGQ